MNGKSVRYGNHSKKENKKPQKLIKRIIGQTSLCALAFLICIPISKTQTGVKNYLSKILIESSDIELAREHFAKMCASIGEQHPEISENAFWLELLKLSKIEENEPTEENAAKPESLEKALDLVAKANPAEFTYPENVNMVMPLNGKVTSPFGEREHPVEGGDSVHYGIDISGSLGDRVTTTAAGKVIEVKLHDIYGNCVLVQHTNRIKSFYAHLDTVAVAEGEILSDGATIGTVGATGLVTGPHLHFGVRVDDVPVDPEIYIKMEHR